MTRHVILTLAVAVTAAPYAAEAQTSAWGTNGYVSFNGMYEARTTTFESVTTPKINQEPARISTTLELPPGLVYDMSVGGRIKGNLGIGFGFAYFKRTEDAQMVGDIPHPFYFDQPRTLDATTPLDHEDFAVHMHGMWLLPVSKGFQIALFGGPTYFQIKQQSITDPKIEDDYPFDTVRLASSSATREKATSWGFNAGLDASRFFSQYVGVSGMVRFSRGHVKLTSAGSDTPPVDVGGLQVGAGIRFRY